MKFVLRMGPKFLPPICFFNEFNLPNFPRPKFTLGYNKLYHKLITPVMTIVYFIPHRV